MAARLRILCTGDFHVGRRPSRLAGVIEPTRCSCAAMFGEVVELAIREKVDAVAISGDIVDKENKYHEAYGPVERGLKKLAAAGIDVFAVAGNHDFDVLPRLNNAVGTDRFHLLGAGGTWEQKALIRDGSAVLNVVGWSFPAEHVADNPMRTFGAMPLDSLNHAPVLALLHADLDQLDSSYAPVPLRDLQAAPVSTWLLGHIHRPRWIEQNGFPGVLYPGSPQAMDPGETGAHGPWMLEIDKAGRIEARQMPMSLVRYDALEIDVSGIDTKEAFDTHIPRQLSQRLQEACLGCGPLELCSVRVTLTGTTRLHAQLKEYCREIREQLQLTVDRFAVRIDDIAIDTRPPVDLQELARGSSVAADLARLLVQLRPEQAAGASADGETAMLISRAAELSEGICGARAYQPLPALEYPSPARAGVQSTLLRQGMLLLDALLEQKRDPHAAGELP